MPEHLDGNSLAGPLSELFRFEPTTAMTMCGGCSTDGALATLLVYVSRMGAVARCPNCSRVLIVHTRTPNGVYLNTSGLRWLRSAVDRQPAG